MANSITWMGNGRWPVAIEETVKTYFPSDKRNTNHICKFATIVKRLPRAFSKWWTLDLCFALGNPGLNLHLLALTRPKTHNAATVQQWFPIENSANVTSNVFTQTVSPVKSETQVQSPSFPECWLPSNLNSESSWLNLSWSMKQLDVDVSPPAFVWNPYLTSANLTFDLDPRDPLLPRHMSNTLMQNAWQLLFLTWQPWPWPMTLTFIRDLDSINVHSHTKFGDPNWNDSWDMNYCPVIFVREFLSRNFCPVTDRQTDRWTDRRKATPKSQRWAIPG